jgi:uncharacterized membrane protein
MDNLVNWHKAHKDNLTSGERAADSMRNRMGSWGFVFGFFIFMAIWAALNTLAAVKHWDVYPFILLNLFLSMLAGLQGAILLIAAKRADSISAAMAKHDYETNLRSKKEIEELMAINRKQVENLEALHKHLKSAK